MLGEGTAPSGDGKEAQKAHVHKCASFFVDCFAQYLLINRSFNLEAVGGEKREHFKKCMV